MTDHDDFAFEPVPGLPARLPRGEEMLWQGRPSAWALTREALWLNWIAGYFALLAIWKFGTVYGEAGAGRALATAVPFVLLGIVVGLIVLGTAWAQARGTVYTITTARVVMRTGAALQVTFNLPFSQIASASLELRRGGTGTIALRTVDGTNLSYFALWPHARPWHMRRTEPALRAIPDAARVAAIFADAAETRVNAPRVARRATAPAMAAE